MTAPGRRAADALGAAITGLPPSGYGVSATQRLFMEAWNPATGENVVVDGFLRYVNLQTVGPIADLAVGWVTVLNTPGRPIILGMLRGPTV